MVDDVDVDDADADDADYARRLLAARVPELTEAQIAAAFAPGMSAELGELVLAVVDAMTERLDALEQSLTTSAAGDEAPTHVEVEAHHPRRVAA
jgi:hypothetical protein